jgi:hypothetical protein
MIADMNRLDQFYAARERLAGLRSRLTVSRVPGEGGGAACPFR